ncbi:mannosyl-3-phosphoglycerate synthase [Alternaria rosae]|uniref:mannosyl-3-phosphoglycerate synthase n=1 Tax=Alternaria rosae TaxID=1187941 RepID=UPI001E8E4D11|nr:mannosyl-3-phosphoglycerate synthase [Alternaria rosae]KAH6864828.1 mannosyl-3-phosphoglycerate synthase [Alternaria rosae]
MRLSIRPGITRVGNVQLHEMSSVSEMDAGGQDTSGDGTDNPPADQENIAISPDSIKSVERDLAIVVPCMDEDITVLEGLLRGIPHSCCVIFISNSNQTNYKTECESLVKFGKIASRPVVVHHQGEATFARAFQEAGMPELLQTPGIGIPEGEEHFPRLNNGKGEAIILGVIIAKLVERKFVGFIDADNRIPGSVLEYCKVYAAGLHYALYHNKITGQDEHATVRIKWKSKPKVRNGELVFEEFGRSSRVVNEWMNRLLKVLGGDATPETMIGTGNAGEHAMDVDLALKLRFATGYAVEPFQLIDLWERYGVSNDPSSRLMRILQIETCNPHIHSANRLTGHIPRMQVQGLSTIYHSPLVPSRLRDELREYMRDNLASVVDSTGQPAPLRIYRPLSSLDWRIFARVGSGKQDSHKDKVGHLGSSEVVGDADTANFTHCITL